MNFNLSDLRAFVAVAELSSFRAAATELHLSQPALSRRIEKLEDALGVRLFDRTTRSVEMTAVGREFSRKARELLNGLEESLLGIRDVATRVTGEVTVACVPSAVRYFLPAVLRKYHERWPRIVVRLIDEGANEVLNLIVRNEADFGLNYIGTQEPDVEFEPVLKEPFVVACPPDHPLARKRKVTWAELGQYDYMTVGKASGNRMLLDLALTDVPDRPQWYCEVRHVSTLVSLVEAGLGVAAVPRLAMPPGKHPTLTSVPLVEPTVSRTVGLIRRRGRSLSPAAQQLYDMLLTANAEMQGAKAVSGHSKRVNPRVTPRT
ncbi:HTH-type transcriptional regulator CynR [compost metagenome]|uniref:LysR family transcriptional regulator n=1 Tax=Cupriavidus campinensis TaxID=151783 RepID=A0AAE9I637_9BURK|nr:MULTISPECIES: LysR family transcriptional regulator [Cupriavidus]TSP14223.1 LysR family transcriptional regulator [Cupriavidus campinensis]URF05740.1 LysR family transcriptional regulator [Cupriavidus campinensis]CAG2155751.1 HTH-type transcriptional regulator CynR [Cupriavidus campinensis]